MVTEQMNVHRALAELKTMDARIAHAIQKATIVVANRHSNTKINGVSVSEYCHQMEDAFKSVNDLIKRRNAIKRAVVLSNAQTIVTIAGEQFTVAEAIDMKNHGMEFYSQLKFKLNADYMTAQAEVARNSGAALMSRADKYIIDMFGNKDKVDAEVVARVKEDYITNQTYELVDPLSVAQLLHDLDAMTAEFDAEVDAALSTSNAITMIEISY